MKAYENPPSYPKARAKHRPVWHNSASGFSEAGFFDILGIAKLSPKPALQTKTYEALSIDVPGCSDDRYIGPSTKPN